MMALCDLGCNTTFIDESLALSLRLQGKYVDLEIQGVNVRKVFTSQHIKKCRVARVGREEVQYSLRDVITVPSLNGPDQKLKWSIIKQEYQHLKNLDLRDTDTGSVQLIIGTNNSDLILSKQIVKPSGQPEVDTVPYAVETPLGWAVTNWLPGGHQWKRQPLRMRVKMRMCQAYLGEKRNNLYPTITKWQRRGCKR